MQGSNSDETTFASQRGQIHMSTQTPRSRFFKLMSTVRSMFPRKIARAVVVTCLVMSLTVVYVTLFKHPAPEELIKLNKGTKSFHFRAIEQNVGKSRREINTEELRGMRKENQTDDVYKLLYDDDREMEATADVRDCLNDVSNTKRNNSQKVKQSQNVELKGKALWDKFSAVNRHTVIGIVLDKCDQPTEQLGTVILLPDDKLGGVMTRTFYNFTLDQELRGGSFHMAVKYNGQDLYDNWWEVCEMEEDLDPADRTFLCPIPRGPRTLIRDKHIPGYLPKGRYETKAWVKNEKEELLVCGFSDFVL